MGLRIVNQNPRWVPRIRRITAHFPWLEAKLQVFVQARSRRDDEPAMNDIQWMVQPDPAALLAWQTLLGATPNKPSH
ncbi:hypothetical protein [Nitrobacter hamburgensis]|uniref:hypothetical protein n=1 Tax=Nitrobacter hamburgensis TaxID=912 RepID=UPI0012EE1AB9|nr:hypothetical protein [Nitrobacter hamburgensis]